MKADLRTPLREILKWLVEFTVGRTVHDVNSGLRVFSKSEILPFLPHLSDKFSFTTSQLLIYMLHMKFVHYVDIDYRKRVGQTKVRLFRDSLGVLQMLFSAIVRHNPLKLFLLLSLVSIGTGIVLFIFGSWFSSDWALFAGVVAMFTSVVVFAMGLMAEGFRVTQVERNVERQRSD